MSVHFFSLEMILQMALLHDHDGRVAPIILALRQEENL